MFKLVLEKAEEPEIKLPTSAGSSKKQESSRKTSISALLIIPKPLTVWITINCGEFFKRWEYWTTWPASWETCVQVRKQPLAWTWNNRLLLNRTWNNRLVPNRKRSISRLYIVTLLMTSVFSWQTLLAFALLHSVFQGQICLLLQEFLDFLLLHFSPL